MSHATRARAAVMCLDAYIPGEVYKTPWNPPSPSLPSQVAASERSVGDIEEELQLPQPSVSKHLRVLREAGFVESRVDAQRRLYRIRPEPLMEVDAWLTQFRRFWSVHVDALERHLDR